MTDRYPPTRQREALLEFALAVGSASTAFRRDDCGDPHISGKRGHVYAIPGGFQFYCLCASRMGWTWAKKVMAFAQVTQDGDEEGMLFLDRLPSEDEARLIRHYLGIRPKPEVSPLEGERRRQAGLKMALRPAV